PPVDGRLNVIGCIAGNRQRRSDLDHGTSDTRGFRWSGITEEFTSRLWQRRRGGNHYAFSARSHRRSDEFLWRVSASFLGECGWPDSERESQRENGAAPTR